MLTLYLSPLLNARGIERPFAWLRKQGFTHNTAHRLLKQPVVMNLAYLEKLCSLLQCTPNDLLLFTPSAHTPLPAAHPLNGLVKKAEKENVAQQLRSLPLPQLDKVLDLIHQLQSGANDKEQAAP